MAQQEKVEFYYTFQGTEFGNEICSLHNILFTAPCPRKPFCAPCVTRSPTSPGMATMTTALADTNIVLDHARRRWTSPSDWRNQALLPLRFRFQLAFQFHFQLQFHSVFCLASLFKSLSEQFMFRFPFLFILHVLFGIMFKFSFPLPFQFLFPLLFQFLTLLTQPQFPFQFSVLFQFPALFQLPIPFQTLILFQSPLILFKAPRLIAHVDFPGGFPDTRGKGSLT